MMTDKNDFDENQTGKYAIIDVFQKNDFI